jgi:hypothetical protein
MITPHDDLFINCWCVDCGYPSQIPGSTPIAKIACNKCNSKNLEYELTMSDQAIQRYQEAYNKQKKGGKK